MNLCELSDDVLLSETLLVAGAERAATALLLHHLCELERRRLFAREGFSSLFDYCLRRLKMSESQAARRVNASRALALMPELGAKIESGSLTLSNLSLAQASFRREPRSLESKRSLLSELEGKTTREAEKILVSHSSLPPVVVTERLRVVSPSLSELRLPVDSELLADLQTLKDLWGLSSLTEVIRKAASVCLKEKKSRAAPLREDASTSAGECAGAAPSAGESRSRYIPAHVKRQVRLRDKGCCTYVDSGTGFVCSSRWRIEFDHVLPFARGGANTVENLRLRCFAHNQWHSIEEFGNGVLEYARASSSSC